MKKLLSPLLFVLLCCGTLKVHAQVDPANNNPMPATIAVQWANLFVLQNDPLLVSDQNAPFAMKVKLYNQLLNLIGTSNEAHNIIYTEKLSPFITDSQDAQGNYHYTVVSGKGDNFLDYTSCLDAIKFRNLLCTNAKKDYSIDVELHSNNMSYIHICLSATNQPSKGKKHSDSYHYQDINDQGNYYNFNETQLDSNLPDSNNFSGEIWVGVQDDSKLTHTWKVLDNQDRLWSYRDGVRDKAEAGAF